ncbi:hypothetical protein T190423A01A_40285 [Tenacibaculum sp. 190130A14a]|uniref:Uncharacterized protein n=1 Tax=Tenacibaculum polynesiense TaxID=3137857 RepID=A0ABP1F5S6_9FLAO
MNKPFNYLINLLHNTIVVLLFNALIFAHSGGHSIEWIEE